MNNLIIFLYTETIKGGKLSDMHTQNWVLLLQLQTWVHAVKHLQSKSISF